MVNVPVIFLSERREFPSALCLAGGGVKPDDNSRKHVVEISRVSLYASSQLL